MSNSTMNKKTVASVYFVELMLDGAGDMEAQTEVVICSSKEEAEQLKYEYDMKHNFEQTAVVGCY